MIRDQLHQPHQFLRNDGELDEAQVEVNESFLDEHIKEAAHQKQIALENEIENFNQKSIEFWGEKVHNDFKFHYHQNEHGRFDGIEVSFTYRCHTFIMQHSSYGDFSIYSVSKLTDRLLRGSPNELLLQLESEVDKVDFREKVIELSVAAIIIVICILIMIR